MVRTRSGEDTGAQFDFGALPDEVQAIISYDFLRREAMTLSKVCRATRGAKEHLVNGLLKAAERPNGAEGILDGLNKMCRLRRGPLIQCCRITRYRHPDYEPQRRLMHILINKLGGHRGAEAEGDVMAWFVALFATAADAEWLLERFLQGWTRTSRLYSLGTDALSVTDNGMRSGAALDRAGFAEMSSASSNTFGALVALDLVDSDGGHGELMKNMDAIAAKLYPPQRLAVRKNAVEATLVSSCSDPRSLLLGDGSADALELYDDRVTLAAVRKTEGGIEEEFRLRARLEEAREDEKEKLLRERNAVSFCCLALPDVMYWAKSMVQGFDVARFLNDPAYRDWIMARCRWGADGDSGELRGCLQKLWPTTYDIASDPFFTACVGLLEAAETEEQFAVARDALDVFYDGADVVGYQERCVDWARLERIISAEDEADAFFRSQKSDWLGSLRTASENDVFYAFMLVGGARLEDACLGPFKVPITKVDYDRSGFRCCAKMATPFFEVVSLALLYGLTGNARDIIDDERRVVDLVSSSIANFFSSSDSSKMLLGSTYVEMHVVGPDGRVYLLHRRAPGGYGAGAQLPDTAAELQQLRTLDHASFPVVPKVRAVAKAVCEEIVTGADERLARRLRTAERPGDAARVAAVVSAAEAAGTSLPFVKEDGTAARVYIHATAKKATFATVDDGELKTADIVKRMGGLPGASEGADWGIYGDGYATSPKSKERDIGRARRAVKVRYLRRIVVGQPLPDVTPDLVWVTVAEKQRLDPSWEDDQPQITSRWGTGRLTLN